MKYISRVLSLNNIACSNINWYVRPDNHISNVISQNNMAFNDINWYFRPDNQIYIQSFITK